MPIFSKFGKWLVTESGQSFSLYVGVAAGIGVFSLYTFPNTFCLGYYLDAVRLYKNGISVQLSESMVNRFDKAMDLCEIPAREKYLYKPFTMYGFEMFNAGTYYSKFGSIIGIPTNFSYNSIKDIDTVAIKIKGESVVWDLPEAKQLQESLILSEDAQTFGICRELEMTRTAYFILTTFTATASSLGVYAISSLANRRYDMYAKGRGVRFTMYGLIGAFVLGNYFLLKDLTTCQYEEYVDKKLRDKSPNLAKGGKEFYEKALIRNKAFRALLGAEGESKFTVHGNFNYFLRTKHLPLVHRRSFFDSEENTVEDSIALLG